jgi:hypothetical protein
MTLVRHADESQHGYLREMLELREETGCGGLKLFCRVPEKFGKVKDLVAF